MLIGLEKRVEVLEDEIAELRERIKQFENVMTTAFGLATDGNLRKENNHG